MVDTLDQAQTAGSSQAVQTPETIGLGNTAPLRVVVQQRQELLRQAGADLDQALVALRRICPHDHVIETPSRSNLMGLYSADPPRRMCLTCGIEELGWGCGIKVLVNQPERIVTDRSEYYHLHFGDSLLVHRCFGCNGVFAERHLNEWLRCSDCAK